MKRQLPCLLFFMLMVTVYANAQQLLQKASSRPISPKNVAKSSQSFYRLIDTATPHDKCGFVYKMKQAESRGFNNAAFENQIAQLVQRKLATGRVDLNGTVTVPIIFHVIFRNADSSATSTASANLATSKFQAQVAQLNIDYGNQAGSMWGVAANVPIRFCMALVDTAGRLLAEPGIDRINGQLRGWTNTNNQSQANLINNFDNTIKPASIWDPYSYVNVWTAAMNTSGLLGYATFPALSTLDGLDNGETNSDAGVVIAWQSVGSVASPGNSSAYGYGRTLTHELGHFFGLRHIWGDDNCGNDYCADTPPQYEETTGCPTTDTLNNCVPLQRKMYENYMDYSYDACLNTFTANQALRSAAVMDNSPRRVSLIASKACVARAANSVAFTTAVPQVVTETGNTGGCPNTRTYSFRVAVSGAATGASTLTFNTTGTATLGRDYTISPASITYTNGETAIKTVNISVIDDQVAEPDETITLSYNISGTGVVAGPDKQVISLTITDDDIADVISVNQLQPVKNILTQDFDTSAGVIPIGWKTEIYTAGTLAANQWTVSVNGGAGTTGRAAHITNDTILKPNTYTNTVPSDAYLFTPLLDASTLRDLNIVFKWRCRGESGYDAGYIGYVPEGQAATADNVIYFSNTFNGQSATASAATANLNLPASMSGKKFYFVFNWYNDETAGNSPGFTVDSIVMTGKSYTVATTVDADTTFSHFTGQNINYFSKVGVPVTNRIIARVAGISTDAGCITASVAAEGTGRTLVTSAQTGSFYRTNKVIQLTPATTVSGATYTVTLYYTTAEMAVWGSQLPTLKMLKISDGAALNGPYQSGDAQLAATTFTDNSALGYYSFTGTFTGGFSRFMLVSPDLTLPVSLLDFTATAKGKAILLQWSTSQEVNNKGFVLERSTDGINFSKIGWVNGKGNTATKTDYSYTDLFVQPNTQYFYRLRQTDLDGKESLSGIRQARINDAGIGITVSPVPAKNNLQVYISGAQQAATISMLNAQGQLVKQWQNASTFNSAYQLDVSAFPAGVYMLKIDVGTHQSVQKIVLEK